MENIDLDMGIRRVLNGISAFGGIEVLSQSQTHASLLLGRKFLQTEEFEGIFRFLKDAKFRMLIDICGVDYPENDDRFEVVYQLLNLEDNLRLTLKLRTNDEVPTLTNLHIGAGWFERETFDMFGVRFVGNKDLRRILTDYGFEHFPLRKDFPTTGFTEVRYSGRTGEVEKFPINLSQEYRVFDFEMPWEGVQSSVKKSS